MKVALGLALGLWTAGCGPQAKDREVPEPATFDHDIGDAKKKETDWLALTADAAPTPRSGHAATWYDGRMYVFGGEGPGGTLAWGGAAYAVKSEQWITLGGTPPTGRTGHTMVATDTGVVVFGGAVLDGSSGTLVETATGGVYRPQSLSWRATSTSGIVPRRGHTAIAAGSKMIVFGGLGPEPIASGAVYDVTVDHWQATNPSGAPSPRAGHTAVWTGTRMLVWGGAGDTLLNDGGAYDPSTDTWTAMSTKDAPAARRDHVAVFAAGKMLVFGGLGKDANGAPIFLGDGGVYDAATNTWAKMSTKNAPTARLGHVAAAAKEAMILYGGYADKRSADGGVYDVASDTWTTVSALPLNPARVGLSAVATDDGVIFWGGTDRPGNYLKTGASVKASDATP